MAKLTARTVSSATPGRHGDGDGLHLYVKPSGRKSWVLRVQWRGRRQDIGLGTVNEAPKRHDDILSEIPLLERRHLRLAEAREVAGILRQFAKAGLDPIAERDKVRSTVPTFQEAMIKTHAALSEGWSDKSAESFLSSLKAHACPTLGSLGVDKVEARDIQEALRPIWTSKPQQARKVRHRITKVLNYAHSQGWRAGEAPGKSVTTGLSRQPKAGNFKAMPYKMLPAFVAEVLAASPTTSREALLYLILTCSRSGEVRQARWGQVDVLNALWICPAEVMKAGEEHVVTLCPEAVRLLEDAKVSRDRTEANDLIFPGSRGAMMSDMTIQRLVSRAGYDYHPHGFRSSFRDWAAEKMPHIPDAVAEAALAHLVPDEVVRAYKRTKFLELRRELLTAWGAHVLSQGQST